MPRIATERPFLTPFALALLSLALLLQALEGRIDDEAESSGVVATVTPGQSLQAQTIVSSRLSQNCDKLSPRTCSKCSLKYHPQYFETIVLDLLHRMGAR